MKTAGFIAALFAAAVLAGALAEAQAKGDWPNREELIRAAQRNPESFVAAVDAALKPLDPAQAETFRAAVWTAMFPATAGSTDPDAAKLEAIVSALKSAGREATVETQNGKTVIVIEAKEEPAAESEAEDSGR